MLVASIQGRGLALRLKGAEWRYLLPERGLVRIIVTKGVPMGLQMLTVSGSMLAVVGLVNRYGVTTLAAFGVTSQLWSYIQMPALALGAAVSAMAAQNIGARRWDRVSRIARSGVIASVVLTAALILLVTVADRPVLGLFLPGAPATLEAARHIHLVVSWSFVLMGVSLVLSGVVRANGAVIGPLVILFIAAVPVRLGFAYAVAPRIGADGVWWSFPASSIVSLLLTMLYYRFAGWRAAAISVPPSPLEAAERTRADCEPAGRMQPTS